MPRRPLAEAVEGLAGDQEALEQEHQAGGHVDAGAAVLAREVITEDRRETEAVEEPADDRQDTDGVRVESAAGVAGDPAGPERGGASWSERAVLRCTSVSPDAFRDRRRWPPPAARLTAMIPAKGERSRGEKFWQ